MIFFWVKKEKLEEPGYDRSQQGLEMEKNIFYLLLNRCVGEGGGVGGHQITRQNTRQHQIGSRAYGLKKFVIFIF